MKFITSQDGQYGAHLADPTGIATINIFGECTVYSLGSRFKTLQDIGTVPLIVVGSAQGFDGNVDGFLGLAPSGYNLDHGVKVAQIDGCLARTGFKRISRHIAAGATRALSIWG